MKRMLALTMVFVPLMVACSDPSMDEVLIVRDARDVKRYSENNSSQISYSVDLKYPAKAFADSTFADLKKRGWSKCSGYSEGWDSFVDASKGEGREQTVFQSNSYWFKDGTLLTLSMRYYAAVAKDKRRLDAPDNAQQQVVVLQNKNPGVKEKLGITCP
jgi:hypothetical protein